MKLWRHNYPLMQTMFQCFAVFLLTGLLLNSGFKFVRDHFLLTTGLSHKDDPIHGEDNGWKKVRYHGDIIIREKNLPKLTRPIYNLKYKTSLPLTPFLEILNDPQESLEWFACLVDHKYKSIPKRLLPDFEHVDLLATPVDFRMVLHPYIRLHDREFVTHLTSTVSTEEMDDGSAMTVATFFYHHVDERDNQKTRTLKPIYPGCTRGYFDMILQLTTYDDGETTDIEMTLDMDMNTSSMSKKLIPAFIMNNMTKRWGVNSLHRLVKLCRSKAGLENEVDVKASLLRLFPIKQ